ncbi:endonuclease/exonuclease/phosphatase family protein [Luteitalea sp.]
MRAALLPGVVCLLATVLVTVLAPSPVRAQATPRPQPSRADYVRLQIPDLLSFDELVTLSRPEPLPAALQARLTRLTTTPFISNEAWYRGARPHRPVDRRLGPSMRVAFWNIERGMRLDDIKLLWTDRETFIRKAAAARAARAHHDQPELLQPHPDDVRLLDEDTRNAHGALRAEIAMLQAADVLILNEVDWGVPRTQYREVVRELGEALDMNWAYGVEFLEIDPKILGTETWHEVPDADQRAALERHFSADPTRLRAMHGSAILSRYPIRAATTTPFKEIGYDWFTGEGHLPTPEVLLRSLSGIFAGDKLIRELRRGGRTSLRVDLDVPELPRGALTVVTPHLENRARASSRRAQMAEVLASIRSVPHPVIVAGDLNSNGSNLAPESFLRLARQLVSVQGLSAVAVKFLTPFGMAYSSLHFGAKAAHTQSDPTVADVPYLAANPEHQMFSMIERFRFDNGGAFDFRGDLERTHDGAHAGTLANSNQRRGKGFASTFEIGTHIGSLGKYKLDWILVKPYLDAPRDREGTYRFAPHAGWTLKLVNLATPERLSDHHPIVTVLPFAEPVVTRRRAPSAEAETSRTTALRLGTFTCADFDALAALDLGAAEARSVVGYGYRVGHTAGTAPLPPFTYEMLLAHTTARAAACASPTTLWIDAVRALGPVTPVPGAVVGRDDLAPATYTCQQFLARRDDDLGLFEAQMLFAFGYTQGLAHAHRETPPYTVRTVTAFASRLVGACQARPTSLWIETVRRVDR